MCLHLENIHRETALSLDYSLISFFFFLMIFFFKENFYL